MAIYLGKICCRAGRSTDVIDQLLGSIGIEVENGAHIGSRLVIKGQLKGLDFLGLEVFISNYLRVVFYILFSKGRRPECLAV